MGLEVLQNRGLEKPIQIQRLLTTPTPSSCRWT